ncbi:UNKNOWN [Stylonychia lemnae]|uniref:IQ calmodulin-binding motif family protein n=1 Tax=Stylonychia lemnae TaxID=5949 RepID=A0A078A4Z2_STYLE|nr:UNKNOWN [Stylonychia lemnae]|eukprot:CDW76640.1 UNKNOWN [Stylonychia lemnae]
MFTQLNNELIQLQISRSGDLSHLIKTYQKNFQLQMKPLTQTSHQQMTDYISKLSLKEESRQIDQRRIFGNLKAFKDINESKQKIFKTVHRKIAQINIKTIEEQEIANQIQWTNTLQLNSQSQLLMLMGNDETFSIQSSNITNIEFKRIKQECRELRNKVILIINNINYILETQLLIMDDKIGQKSKKDFIYQLQNYYISDQISRNQEIKAARTQYQQKYNENKERSKTQFNKLDDSNSQINQSGSQNKQISKQFKGLETLQMLQRALGENKQTNLKEIQREAKSQLAGQRTIQASYVLAESSNTASSFYKTKTNQSINSSQSKRSIKNSIQNDFHEIQADYLNQLESNFKNLQSIKSAKKFQIMRALRHIQRWWKIFNAERKLKAVQMIERNYKLTLSDFMKLKRQIIIVMKRYSANKIQRWYRLWRKKRVILRQKQNAKILGKYLNQLGTIIKLQSFIRGCLIRKALRFKRYLKKLRVQRQNDRNQEKKIIYYRTIRVINSARLHNCVQKQLQERMFYIQQFEKQFQK